MKDETVENNVDESVVVVAVGSGDRVIIIIITR